MTSENPRHVAGPSTPRAGIGADALPDLNLPIITGPMLPPRSMTMDEIDACIEHDIRYVCNREAYLREKKLREVHVPFVLGD